MTDEANVPKYPADLLKWAGNRSGGVRRPFDEGSGRPGASVFRTNLLSKLEHWCRDIGAAVPEAPRIVLLVGGPGNGKTEAIEKTMAWLDDELGSGGGLVDELSRLFRPADGVVPRLVSLDAGALSNPRRSDLSLTVVQDASAPEGESDKSPAELLLHELDVAYAGRASGLYLCCVNRGVLDDALIVASEASRSASRELLETVTRAVSIFPGAPSCWPLDGHPQVAVWPMDMESLMLATDDGNPPPAQQVLHRATDARFWPSTGTCAANGRCPFCTSRDQLSSAREQDSLLSMLRWYELGSGKRWSFRDLFSLFSYLLAGHRHESRAVELDPCSWAANLLSADDLAARNGKPSATTSSAIFELVAAQYHQGLFHLWDRGAGPALLRDIRELGLQDNNTAMGLQWFLSARRSPYLPAMIASVLDSFANLLDPAVAHPDTEVAISKSTTIRLRDIETRFSRSVEEGLAFARKHRKLLTLLELDLLGRLAELDTYLARQDVRKKRPATATRMQRSVRDFACRLVKRSIGARTGTVRDASLLEDFKQVVEAADDDGVYDVAREIELLLNKHGHEFEVSLTTTFGQPLPPANLQALLVVDRRHVQPAGPPQGGRPAAPLRFLEVGEGPSAQNVALTYELFKAVKDIDKGMSEASLPRSVLALLDTTAARLAGPIVRDERALRRAEIRLGNGVTIQQRQATFGLVTGGKRK